jgi:signal transduction histidine kinase
LEAAVADASGRPGGGALLDDARVRVAWHDVKIQVEGETTTPWYPGERDLYETQVRPVLERVHTGLARDEADPGRSLRLEADFDALDDGLQALLALNHSHGFKAAAGMMAAQRSAEHLAWALGGACTLLALGGALLAIHSARRYAAATEKNSKLLLARGQELEFFAERVAHDLVGPLATMTFALELAERDAKDEALPHLHRARHALARAGALVRGVLDFALAGGQPNPGGHASLGVTMRNVVDEVRGSEADAEITIEPFEDREVACDEFALGLILSNLIRNAVKYSRGTPSARVTLRTSSFSDRVRVSVEDTGPGLAPGLENTIFDPYVRGARTKEPGVGLGLATVKRFVDAYGGHVGVGKRDGKGAVFWFELPRPPRSVTTYDAVSAIS